MKVQSNVYDGRAATDTASRAKGAAGSPELRSGGPLGGLWRSTRAIEVVALACLKYASRLAHSYPTFGKHRESFACTLIIRPKYM